MAKKEFAFAEKFQNTEMPEEEWEDPRDRARRERKQEEAVKAAEKVVKEKKATSDEPKEKPAKVKKAGVFEAASKEVKEKIRINTYLDSEIGEYVVRMAEKYKISRNEVVNLMLRAAMDLDLEKKN